MLECSVEAHFAKNSSRAQDMISICNTEEIRNFIETMWGSASKYPEQANYIRWRPVDELPTRRPKSPDRMPNAKTKQQVVARDGYRCRYCGLWLIPAEVRKTLNRLYPEALPWGRRNSEQHSAFQALWLQFDHVAPASYGGDSTIENIVVCCASCNFGKSSYHLDELGLVDPRERDPIPTQWNGLTELIASTP